jgi:hypothetical protein
MFKFNPWKKQENNDQEIIGQRYLELERELKALFNRSESLRKRNDNSDEEEFTQNIERKSAILDEIQMLVDKMEGDTKLKYLNKKEPEAVE